MASSKLKFDDFDWFLHASDKDIHMWYELFYPKGHEDRLSAFKFANCSPVTSETTSPPTLNDRTLSSTSKSSKSSDDNNNNNDNAPSSSSNVKADKKPPFCVFCYNNDELPFVYNSHYLRDKKGMVECPVLREKVCEFCGVSGDKAHTPKYCPKRPAQKYGKY